MHVQSINIHSHNLFTLFVSVKRRKKRQKQIPLSSCRRNNMEKRQSERARENDSIYEFNLVSGFDFNNKAGYFKVKFSVLLSVSACLSLCLTAIRMVVNSGWRAE